MIREGIANRPAWLTLGDIYPVLSDRLARLGLPRPDQRGTDMAPYHPFTRNAALAVKGTDPQAVAAVVSARRLLIALISALLHAVSSAVAAAAARAQAESLGRELARERDKDGRLARAFHKVRDGVVDSTRAVAGRGAQGVADGFIRDRDRTLDRARGIAGELALTLATADRLDAGRDAALRRASGRAADLADVLTSPSLRNLALATARALAQTHVDKVRTELAAVHLDASGLDLSDLGDVDPDNLAVLVGVIWNDETTWPPALAAPVRERSRQLRPGVYQVESVSDDEQFGRIDASSPTEA
ncbi:hypothetical protein AB0J72_42450 [Dactylosporangium sp. NPDC049742]|uniref:hypothetical protein n=1 Tax=Dactylosporangium sp. NPDC049742 TaxID=3154737 RepID=UPI003421CC4D